MSVTLRCLIVDDSAGFLDAASTLLEFEGISVVGVASTCADALDRISRLRPDVALVDVNLGDENGFELATRIDREIHPRPRVIMISTHAEEDFADLLTSTPAVGFLSKSDLSAGAIHDLLRSRGDGGGSVSERPGT